MSNLTLHKLYNPHQIPKKILLKSFVIRIKEFNKIFNDIKNYTIKKSNQHFVIQGQRGTGKSTMLLRLKYEIENLENKIPILFDEEEYGITSLEEIWERIWEIIEDEEYFQIPTDIEKNYDSLKSILKEKNKIIVLLIDNLGNLLENFDDENDEFKLREILQHNKHIKVVGGSAFALETFYSYEKPFYDFFNVITISGLNYDDTITYLSKLGETYDKDTIEYIIKNTPERIRTLQILTGGNPRTIGILFEIFITDKNGTVFQDLEKLLDNVTALYKHRMDEMSKQHRKIVSAIAQNWESISVKELVVTTKMESKAISAQLTKLVKNDIIEIVPTQTKNNLYCIKERFFNIWYLMRYKKKNSDKIRWLIEFMNIWYDNNMLKNRVSSYYDEVDYYYNKLQTFEREEEQSTFFKQIPINVQYKVLSAFLIRFSVDSFIKDIKIEPINIIPIIKHLNKDDIDFYMLTLLEEKQFKFLQKLLINFYLEWENENITNILFGLIAKKQFNSVNNFFENCTSAKDKYLAIYYTNIKFLEDKNKLNKIPKEIKLNQFFNMKIEKIEKFHNDYIYEIKEKLNEQYNSNNPHIQ